MSPTTQAAVHIRVHIRNHLELYPFPHTHTHTYTNSLDGIWLCDLSCVVWGFLLLNPLNALGIPPSSFPSVSLLHIPPSVLLHGWMNTYHLSDKEPSTLVLTLSCIAMFRAQTRHFTDASWPHLPDQPRRECCITATVFQLGQLAHKIFFVFIFLFRLMGSKASMTAETSTSVLKKQHELDLVSLRVDNVLKGE